MVIAIIGVLVALLLPAVQAAREAARRAQCQNNIKQLSIGVLNHESAMKRLPTGGWGYDWTGHPDRGFGPDQPGGWAYNILDHIEGGAIRKLGAGQTGAGLGTSLTQAMATPLPTFNCPSRRPAKLFTANKMYRLVPTTPTQVARTDYAANAGDEKNDFQTGPDSLAAAANYAWAFDKLTGVVFQRSMVRLKDIGDGASNTFMVGERYINPDDYETGIDPADDQNTFVGYNHDTLRWSTEPPMQDRPGLGSRYAWGSAHVIVFNMALCDGSVRPIAYAIDDATLRAFGNRDDGKVASVQ